jgi:alpha-tubulin suppressor-like RCC1 family protein
MEELRRWLPVTERALVVAGGDHSFLHLETGVVYACGANQLGQLGLGDDQYRSRWQQVAVPGMVRAVVAGECHSFLLLETGEVYACGYNGDGQLGLEDSRIRYTWHLVPVPGAVRRMVVGGYHSFLSLETGEWYVCGFNDYGQLGLGSGQDQSTSAKWQRVPEMIRTVAGGGYHSLLLLETGEVYACGFNQHGQLGLGDTQNRSAWQQVPMPFTRGTVRLVAAGGKQSFLLLETGDLYACGSNQYGQLGLGDTQNRSAWQRVVTPGAVRTVAAGKFHSALLLETGEVYSCGSNHAGQLGLGDNQDRNRWQRVTAPGVVRAVALGEIHSLLQLETGEVYACGANYSGQLGLGDRLDRNTWQLSNLEVTSS